MDNGLAHVKEDIDRLEQSITGIYTELRQVRISLMRSEVSDNTAATVMSLLSDLEDKNTTNRQLVNKIHDDLIELRKTPNFTGEQLCKMNIYESQGKCIEENISFLADRIDFLMTTSVGFININQNKAIKQISKWTYWVTIPMFLASLLGMNVPWPWL